MARVQNTLIGKSSGSVGGATMSTWKGINVLKSKAIVVANPKTQLQRNQRQRMSILVAAFRLIAGVIDVGFAKLATAKSAYNAFVQSNLIAANYTGIAPSMVYNWASLLISKGTVAITDITAATGTNASANVVVTYPTTALGVGQSVGDLAYAAVYNATQDVWAVNTAGSALRSAGTITVVLPAPAVTADVLHAYLFFKNPVSGEVSDSDYFLETV